MNFMRNLNILDTFGVPIQVTFNTQNKFRSQIGAIVSIIVYSLSLIYAIYVFEEWINWKMLPKVQTQIDTIKYTTVQMEEGDVTFGYFNETTIDPFRKIDNILTPKLIKLNNTNYEMIGAYFSELRNVNYASDKRFQVSLPAMNLTLSKGENFATGANNEISYFLSISICEEQYLIGTDANCASQQEIKDFLSTAKTLDINFNLKQFNAQTQQFETIQKTLYFTIQNENILFSQIMLKTTKQTVDSGIIFNDYQIKTFLDDFNVITEYLTPSVLKRYHAESYVMQFFIRLDNIQTTESVAYNKLGEILAQVGSIVQLLLIVKYGVILFNQQLLIQQLVEDIVLFQYPQLRILQIEKNILGQVVKVKKEEQIIETQDYLHFFDQAKIKILEKMDLNRIIKEIIEIQAFIFNTFNFSTQIQSKNNKSDDEYTKTQLAKIFPLNEEIELKSSGCLRQSLTEKLEAKK